MANVRWKDKASIGITSSSLDTGDTIPVTDVSASETDKHFHPSSMKAFVNNAPDFAGSVLTLDADGDTTITADTDDQIDIAIAGADDFQFTANTFNALSGSTIQEAGVDISPIGQHTVWVPAAAMEPRVTTAAATSNAIEVATSLIPLRSMDFAQDADDFAGFHVQMPKSWDAGTVIPQIVWSATDTGNVHFNIKAASITGANSAMTDTGVYGAADEISDSSTLANRVEISAEGSGITAGDTGVAEDWVYFELSRNTGDTGDTLGVDARVHGVRLHYTTSAATDD